MILYTDHDERACAWLRQLVADGHLHTGDVRCASITELKADELSQYTQVHHFCGIGGWPLALQLAGWPADRPVWSGSCPCQPFSSAGKQKGHEDERHLWPAMYRLISECRPAVVFGEQVEAAVRLGWVDGVRADLEAEGYAFGFHVLGAHSVGAPHIRQRIFWVANANGTDGQSHAGAVLGVQERARGHQHQQLAGAGADERLAHGDNIGQQRPGRARHGWVGPENGGGTGDGRVADTGERGCEVDLEQHGEAPQGTTDRGARRPHADGHGEADWVEHAQGDGRNPWGTESDGRGTAGGCGDGGLGNTNGDGCRQHNAQEQAGASAAGLGPWGTYVVVPCGDGKSRRLEPGTAPLVDGLPGRVGLLRGYGNAIVPQVAAAFVEAVMEMDH